MRRLLRWTQFLAAGLGFLIITVTVTPVLRYWTNALSTPWGDKKTGGVLIVLGGDMGATDLIGMNSYLRSYYAVREWRTQQYEEIIITGKDIAPLMSAFITAQGVPPQVIQLENAADSTRQNALLVAQLLQQDTRRKVLLTSDFHMKRALGAFRKAGIDAIPIPIPDALKRLQAWSQRWDIFGVLLEETAKLVYYEIRGWA